MSELLPPAAPTALVLNKKDVATALLVLQAFPIATLPEITQVVLSSYHFWWIAPVLTTLLALSTLRSRQNSGTWPALCVVLTLITGLAAWQLINVSCLNPILEILGKLSKG